MSFGAIVDESGGVMVSESGNATDLNGMHHEKPGMGQVSGLRMEPGVSDEGIEIEIEIGNDWENLDDRGTCRDLFRGWGYTGLCRGEGARVGAFYVVISVHDIDIRNEILETLTVEGNPDVDHHDQSLFHVHRVRAEGTCCLFLARNDHCGRSDRDSNLLSLLCGSCRPCRPALAALLVACAAIRHWPTIRR